MLRYPRLGLGLRLLLHAVAVVSLTAVATSTDTSNPFTWLDCPSPAPAPSPSSPASPTMNTSTFQSNVFALLDALPTAAAPTGFASLSRGDGTDRAFVRGLCRGDSTPENCTRYLQKAVLHIKAHCNSNRRAAIWYDKCFLSYADTNEPTTYEEGFRQGICHDRKISDSDMDAFNTKTYVYLMINISDGAAHGEEGSSSALPSAVPMFETGEAVYDRGAPNGTMYGMVQCMRDRTAAECALCLWNSMWQLATSCSGHQGGVMLGYNCYLRVEIYSYYNLSLDAPNALLPLAPAPSRILPNVQDRHSYEPLSWARRVQIALDSARGGLEYIHEHIVPVYIHRDVKSANILIDKNCRAKVRIFHGCRF
ncbi:hypothetical protein HU200_061407 [Digitaria exilis]|uniref:Gnk2-homologous domain-containing protein n=1 Tax=Digitaria exilis TaxID=1010633 RepID=A0A835AAR1_9POAL|nr:hypothetical protein HU200_061407 [Digitaria exilis]